MAIPDEQLIALFRDRNDLDAVEILLGRYQDPIFGFLLSMLREPHDAEDALQETLFKAVEGFGKYRKQQQFKAWIYRIARNEALTLRRKRKPMTPQEDPYQGAAVADIAPFSSRANAWRRLRLWS